MQIRNQRCNRREVNVSAVSSQQLVWERLCSRMGNMGTYRLLQINGQRKFFDPLDDSPPVGDGCEVFIGRIPKDMFEDELVPLFALYGPIHELRLMMNFSGLNRGFAFVMYKRPKYAEEAIRKLDNFQVREGQCIGVIPSVNNRRLYIGKLNPSSTESNLVNLLSTLTEGLQAVSLHAMKKMNEKIQRKYAIAVYVSHRHAAMARRYLILRRNEIFCGDVSVDWACPNIRLDKSGGREHCPPPAIENVPKSPSVASPPKAATLHSDLQKPPKTEAFPVKPKHIRPNQLYSRLPKDEKLSGHTGSKGPCYGRLTAPLYSLSPVPKPNSLVHLRPPSVLRVLHDGGALRGNGKPIRTSNPSDKDKQRPKDEKAKRNRVKTAPRFAPMIPCAMPGPA